MSHRPSFHSTAIRNTREYADYISKSSIDAALRFYEAVSQTALLIAEHPSRTPRYEGLDPRLGDVRRRAVVGFERYLVFYRVHDEMVEVLRVIHGSRDIPRILAEELTDE